MAVSAFGVDHGEPVSKASLRAAKLSSKLTSHMKGFIKGTKGKTAPTHREPPKYDPHDPFTHRPKPLTVRGPKTAAENASLTEFARANEPSASTLAGRKSQRKSASHVAYLKRTP